MTTGVQDAPAVLLTLDRPDCLDDRGDQADQGNQDDPGPSRSLRRHRRPPRRIPL